MNLNHLYYFRALAKEEHYTRTAVHYAAKFKSCDLMS